MKYGNIFYPGNIYTTRLRQTKEPKRNGTEARMHTIQINYQPQTTVKNQSNFKIYNHKHITYFNIKIKFKT